MSGKSNLQPVRNLTGIYSAVQASYWMTFCIYISFAAAYLKDLGYSNTGTGTVLALGNVLGAVLAPVLSERVDRDARVKPARIIPVLLALQGVSFAVLLIFSRKSLLTSIVYVCCIGISCTVNPMNIKMYVDFVRSGKKIVFGVARGLGSFAYVFLSFFMGWLTGRMSTTILPVAGIILTGFQFAMHAVLCRQETNGAADEKTGTEETIPVMRGQTLPAFFKSNPHYTLMLCGVALLFFAHNISVNFLVNVAENLGGGTAEVGYLNAFMAATEIPVMIFFLPLFGKYDLKKLLAVAFCLFTVKDLAIAFSPALPFLYASFLLQAPSFALYTAAIVPYVDKTIPYADAAKAQSLAASMTTVGAIFASFGGGFLYDHTSVFYTLLVAVFISAAGTLLACSGLRGKKVDR